MSSHQRYFAITGAHRDREQLQKAVEVLDSLGLDADVIISDEELDVHKRGLWERYEERRG